MQAKKLIQAIENLAPINLAWERDNVGLQVGHANQEITRVMTTLDVRPEVVTEAIEHHVDFIFSHHPIMFHPAKNLDLSDPQNKMYADLLKNNITVYSAHTNLDAAQNGMNDWLAQALGLSNLQPLLPNSVNPQSGLGRIGDLAEPISIQKYAEFIRDLFKVKVVRVIANDLNRTIQKIAVIGGDGGSEYITAQQMGAEALITADLYYHTGHDVLAHDFVVIDPDHHMEAIVKDQMTQQIKKWQQTYSWDLIEVFSSKVNTDPYTYI
ncbi:Nif3-like dinuclear metal center hexameric protein [Weissella coleopterorum]|uniref:GTP cyclohydrolase 1 type 2 homolog n=1 Tax=Weissella coleopterorum TaxID=2714949 RepID=A0A6G8B0D4_9LACO|nr:Nif3-like dinuclear metal center hexameric protein [Weissella coleopterorum]QIL50716.1 Nif3-like dinuclear metal center hexameric protein [Weissella coleopterorum]